MQALDPGPLHVVQLLSQSNHEKFVSKRQRRKEIPRHCPELKYLLESQLRQSEAEFPSHVKQVEWQTINWFILW